MPSDSHAITQRTWFRRLLFAGKIGVSIGLLAILFGSLDLAETTALLRRIDASTMAVLAGLAVVQTLLLALRWLCVQAYLEVQSGFPATLRITLVGLFFNQTLPTSFGGDAVRVILLRRYSGSYAKSISSVMLDRITALAAVLVMIGVGLPLLANELDYLTLPVWFRGLILAAVLPLIAIVLLAPALARLLLRFGVPSGIAALLTEFRGLLVSPRWLAPTMAVSILIHLFTCIVIYAMAVQMGVAVSFSACLVIVPVVILVSSLPFSFAGWGLREGAMVFAMAWAGVAGADALALSIGLGALLIVVGLPGGVLWLLGSRRQRSTPSGQTGPVA